ncbi:DUF4190 domain-containing protein [Compostimonas suwonensis]|uniref:DUF4190 domain-containing protein n=1 Tax=Compostimonas suwonensis TaxID=1048394 RepID=A0A2M9C438_9MICO|nr:DUF4190 domain-containing protein [Compostimonas suwonensis]PJJ65227.1 hypothetical protein CLV54_0256 [Compostimonas suwonensis]
MSDYNGTPGQVPPAGAPVPPPNYAPAAPQNPGKTLGIVGFILSFFVSIVGLVLSIIAMVQSRKAGQSNGFALAGIIISSLALIVTIIVIIVVAVAAGAVLSQCAELGNGEHLVNGVMITCNM